MNAQTFVLHLTRARKRRDNAHALLETCGLPGEIWAAVDGAALSPQDLSADLSANLFDPPYPFTLKTGEIGCFLSHRQIWAEIVHRDLDYAIVFEDDVKLDPAVFPDALDLAVRHVQSFGVVQLQNRHPRGPARLIDVQGKCQLSFPTLTPVRLSAQLISRWGAEKLLEKAGTFDRPVDTYVQSHWFTGLRPGVVYPGGIRTISDALDGSTIQIGRKSLPERLHREVARFVYRRRIARLSKNSSAPFPEVEE